MAPSEELGSRTHEHVLLRHVPPKRVGLVTLVAVLALTLAPPAGAARKPPKPKRCPAPLTKVTVPSFSTVPPGSGTTTTTVPCRAVSLDKHASYIGVLSWGISQPVPSGNQLSDAVVDLALRDDGHGELTGKLSGTESQTLLLSTCPSSTVSSGHRERAAHGNARRLDDEPRGRGRPLHATADHAVSRRGHPGLDGRALHLPADRGGSEGAEGQAGELPLPPQGDGAGGPLPVHARVLDPALREASR